jgi:hypothetical protein
MRVLLTNNSLFVRAGTELYVRDVAIELMRRGHRPVAYSTRTGLVAKELRGAGVPVIDTLAALSQPPDLIHGHHHYETLTALLRFPGTPAIYFCHGWLPWQEAPLRSPQIRRYVAVDELCRERLIVEGGVAPDEIELHPNFFDGLRFRPRPPLPARPRKALAFGNLFQEAGELDVLREACRLHAIELETAGHGAGASEDHPERRLGQYEIVFAKAKCAIEALAVGAAVILCGYRKLGPLVTRANFDELRRWNFGLRTVSQPLTVAGAEAELRRYDAAEAGAVSAHARERCELRPAVDRLLALYADVLDGVANRPPAPPLEWGAAAAAYLEKWADRYKRGAEEELQQSQWADRAAIAEARLAAAQDEHRLQGQRLTAAERSLEQSANQAGRLGEENVRLTNLLQGAETELRSLKSSATWRWSQAALGSRAMKAVLGWWIRSVAERSASRIKTGPAEGKGTR